MSDIQDLSGAVAGDAEPRAAAAKSYPLVPGYRVNVRQGPSTTTPVVRQLPAGSYVQIRCQRHGQRVSGPTGVSDIWDAIGGGGYVSDSYVRTGSSGFVAPQCTS
ncbi:MULTISPECIES: SH3 domain-containing protein [Streptomyces]|uniref:SH3 domain-containing protein n=1 Tax=Streptomyces ramulosus TaxID=47762 RepID=A0ABW1FLW4_9ACTN